MKRKKWRYFVLLFVIVLVISGTGYGIFLRDSTIENEPIPEVITYQLDEKSAKIIKDIELLEQNSKVLLNTENVGELNDASMALIRKDRYGFNSPALERLVWDSFAGSMPEGYINYFEDTNNGHEQLLQSIEGMVFFTDPVTGASIDFIHMIATTDVCYTELNIMDYEEKYYDYLLGWGGDLLTFSLDVIAYADNNNINSYEELYQYAYQTIGSRKDSYFSEEDFLADVDGVNIGNIMKDKELLLSEALKKYYIDGIVDNRFTLFINSFGGEEAFKEAVNCFMNENIEEKYKDNKDFVDFMSSFEDIKSLMLKSMGAETRKANSIEKKAAVEAFINLILEP